jgi:hypothetical protein
MKQVLIFISVILSCFISGCSGVQRSVQETQTAAVIASAGGAPGAGIIGAAAGGTDLLIQVANFFKDINKPKVGKVSTKLGKVWSKTEIVDVYDEHHKFVRHGDYAIEWENGNKKKVLVKDIPRNLLNQRAALNRALAYIANGILADDDTNLLNNNLKIWKDKGLLVMEYRGYYHSSLEDLKIADTLRKGPEGAAVIAVSDKNEPFEIMLPDEWEERKADFVKGNSKSNTSEESKTDKGNQR